jgi:spoIIIJ-associated protein
VESLEQTTEQITENPEELIEGALDFLAHLLGAMEVASTITIQTENPQQLAIQINTDEDAGVLIGRKGQTLQSIQYLMNVIYGSRLDRRIQLDVSGYRQRQGEKLAEDVAAAAAKVRENGDRFTFEPMPASDRRALHQIVADEYQDLQTFSIGEDPDRTLVLELKGAEGSRPTEISRWQTNGGRELRNFDSRRGGAYQGRRPR